MTSFYEFYEGLQEGWDGPALLVFSDGEKIGARLDRNGLRPARFWQTNDDYIYVASEVGPGHRQEVLQGQAQSKRATMKGKGGSAAAWLDCRSCAHLLSCSIVWGCQHSLQGQLLGPYMLHES